MEPDTPRVVRVLLTPVHEGPRLASSDVCARARPGGRRLASARRQRVGDARREKHRERRRSAGRHRENRTGAFARFRKPGRTPTGSQTWISPRRFPRGPSVRRSRSARSAPSRTPPTRRARAASRRRRRYPRGTRAPCAGRRERSAPAFGAKHTSSKPSFSPVNPPVNPVNPAPPPGRARRRRSTRRARRAGRASSTSAASRVRRRRGEARSPATLRASAPPRKDSVLCTLPLSPSPRLVHLGWNRSPSETRSVSKGSTHKPPDAHAAARDPPLASGDGNRGVAERRGSRFVSRRARGRCVTPSSRKFPRDNPNASWLRRSHATLASYGRRVFLEVPGGVFRFRASVSSSSVVTFVSTFVSTFASPRAFVRAYASTRYSYAHLLSAALASASRRASLREPRRSPSRPRAETRWPTARRSSRCVRGRRPS